MEIFHGGCHGCIQQDINGGTDFCHECQYRRPNWNLPDLSLSPSEAKECKIIYHDSITDRLIFDGNLAIDFKIFEELIASIKKQKLTNLLSGHSTIWTLTI